MTRKRFGSRKKYRATKPLEIIHSDVCQLSSTSREGYQYFVSFIDDFSKFVTVYHLKLKSQVFKSFMHFKTRAERETGFKIIDLRSNNGGEFISKRMQSWCRQQGIRQKMGPPHTPELNGVAERFNRTLIDRLKPSLKQSSLSKRYWSDALDYAVWTTNRSPTQTNDGFKTPCELYEEALPSMRHAHVFGTKGVYLVPSADRRKLDDNTQECVFLGVLPHGDGVKVLDTSSKRVVKTRDAFFSDAQPLQEDSDTSPVGVSNKPSGSPWIYPDEDVDRHDDNRERDVIDRPPVENHQPPSVEPIFHHLRRNRHAPERYGNLRAHSATVMPSRLLKKENGGQPWSQR